MKRSRLTRLPLDSVLSGEMVQVEFTSQAETDLARIDRTIAQRIFKKIRWLADNLEHISLETLTGVWQGFYKLRVGDYRVIYSISRIGSSDEILVHFIRHRREVYKIK